MRISDFSNCGILLLLRSIVIEMLYSNLTGTDKTKQNQSIQVQVQILVKPGLPPMEVLNTFSV